MLKKYIDRRIIFLGFTRSIYCNTNSCIYSNFSTDSNISVKHANMNDRILSGEGPATALSKADRLVLVVLTSCWSVCLLYEAFNWTNNATIRMTRNKGGSGAAMLAVPHCFVDNSIGKVPGQ